MPAKEFEIRVSAMLGGYGWKARFARGCKTNYATVKRWANGASPIPGPVEALVEALEGLCKAGAPFPSTFA